MSGEAEPLSSLLVPFDAVGGGDRDVLGIDGSVWARSKDDMAKIFRHKEVQMMKVSERKQF